MDGLINSIKKYHIPLILSLIILVVFLAMIALTPPFHDAQYHFEEFTVILPNDSQVKEIDGGMEVSGPYREYYSQIVVLNANNSWYKEGFQKLQSEGYAPSVSLYNDTHYLVSIELSNPLHSDNSSRYFHYDFIISKNDYNDKTFEITNENATMVMIRTYDLDFIIYLEKSFKLGGD